MDGLTLLADARFAGLTVTADGDRLVIRGPASADAEARLLLANKGAVLAALAAEAEADARGELRPDDETALDALDEDLAMDVAGREEGVATGAEGRPDPALIWWDDAMPAGSAPVRLIPPTECIAPLICSRLGECPRFAAGEPCLVAS